jgi:hypothetical protein
MRDIFRPILFCNGVTNCYNAFAGLLIVVSLPNLPIPGNSWKNLEIRKWPLIITELGHISPKTISCGRW